MKIISYVKIRIGEHNLVSSGEGSLTELNIDVASYVNHESYKTSNHDITIIELSEAVDLNTYTPACMAKSSDTTTFDGKSAWIYGKAGSKKMIITENCPTGWGALSYGTGDYPDVLMELEVNVVTQETCTAAMSDFATINEGMICAGGVAGQDSCQVWQMFSQVFSQIFSARETLVVL